MKLAGLKVIKKLKHYDSVINYFPLTSNDLKEREDSALMNLKQNLINKIGIFAKFPFSLYLYKKKVNFPYSIKDETVIPGRMYSYIAVKK